MTPDSLIRAELREKVEALWLEHFDGPVSPATLDRVTDTAIESLPDLLRQVREDYPLDVGIGV